jgi:uncharacterized protein
MRISEADILLIPGWTGSGPDHWQSRWARGMRSARVVEQDNWNEPDRDVWTGNILRAVRVAVRPVVLVAHSCGVLAVVHAAPRLAGLRIAGAFLVAPGDLEAPAPFDGFLDIADPAVAFPDSFVPIPMQRLTFPARLIGSATDPYCTVQRTQEFGAAWGADTSIIPDAGHINMASGHGPWPEGLLTFGEFLAKLS